MAARRREQGHLLDQAARPFYEAMGMCIAAWADVDEQLFLIFRQCLGAPPTQSAIIYFRISSLDTRRGVTEELVSSILPKTTPSAAPHPSMKMWSKATAGFETLVKTRNRIAHHR